MVSPVEGDLAEALPEADFPVVVDLPEAEVPEAAEQDAIDIWYVKGCRIKCGSPFEWGLDIIWSSVRSYFYDSLFFI